MNIGSPQASQPLPGWLNVDDFAPSGASPYSDRICAPGETVRRLTPFFPAIGITRLAQVTNLDRIGIPVWMSVRPNAATLSVSQGKGVSDDDARASAAMEATELSVAESLRPGARIASRAGLEKDGLSVADTRRLLRRDTADYQAHDVIRWLEGFDLIAQRAVFVPEECAGFASAVMLGVPSVRYRRSSDGLASGNIFVEAVFHGLCERIERDAMALWAYRSDRSTSERLIDPASFGDPLLDDLSSRVAGAGLRLRLYDATTDIGVPTFFAVIAPRRAAGDIGHLELASGSGCHPVAVRAALRAVTEAAQSRLTTISGARDDFAPAEYRLSLSHDLAVYLDPAIKPTMAPRPGYGGGTSLADLLSWTVDRLGAARIGSAIAVPLGGDVFNVAVAKVIVTELEDQPDDPDYRPGRRAVRAMMSGL